MCPSVDMRCYKVKGPINRRKVYYGNYSHDPRGGPQKEKEIPGGDAATFKELGPVYPEAWSPCSANCPVYGKDKDHVYLQGVKLEQPGLDPESFRYLGRGYSADKNHVYQWGKILKGFDPKEFKFQDGYWQDGKSAHLEYVLTLPKAGLKRYGGGYYGDGARIYTTGCNTTGKIVEGADLNSFRVLKDKNGGDSAYAVDGHNAYFCGAKLSDVDVATLTLVDAGIGKVCDKNRCY